MRDDTSTVVCAIEHDGVTGYGEAAPIERYDETCASAVAFLEASSPDPGSDPFALEDAAHVVSRELARLVL